MFSDIMLFASITLGLACLFMCLYVKRLEQKLHQAPPMQTFTVEQVIKEAESKLAAKK